MMSVRLLINMSQPVITIVDHVLQQAIAAGASDIHFEPTEKNLRMRFRIDGVLLDLGTIDAAIMSQIISRLKVLAHIDIAEKRVPQDGKFSMQVNNTIIDLRVSTFPSLYGQKVVVRILDRAAYTMTLEKLGFSEAMLRHIQTLMYRPNGFFLVTGPTGCGKTTTLYAALAALNTAEKNIVTLEDPVEYNLEGITQGHINPDAGFTFEKGIRALLRQDPDILMVGEVRDKQTARVAIEAALTGHVVLSTLHTNDAPSAIMRLMDMGIEPFLINASLTGVLAQRLARKICTQCCEQVHPNDQEKQILDRFGMDDSLIYRGSGCGFCNHVGYKGRVGIFELLATTSALRALVVQQPIFDDIHGQALRDGMCTLQQDGIHKARQGIISLQELVRAVA
jgi:type IV pilus assembly protein PilB